MNQSFQQPLVSRETPPSSCSILTLVEAPLSLRDILKAVSVVSRVSLLELEGQQHHRRIARARQVYFYLARRLTKKSFPQIVKHCGGKDHSTVHYGCRRVEAYRPEYEANIRGAMERLGFHQ